MTMLETIKISTSGRETLVDVTAHVQEAVRSMGLAHGAVLVYCPHTTAGVFVNEGADPDVGRDIQDVLSSLVPSNRGYRHVEGNAPSHVKSVLVGHSVVVPVRDSELVLGTWQKIFLAEFDGPRSRRLLVQGLSSGG